MDLLNNPTELKEVLKYDSFVGSDLTAFERMLIHKRRVSSIDLSEVLTAKIERIYKTIRDANWTAPEALYNSARLLEVYNPETEQWELFRDPKEINNH